MFTAEDILNSTDLLLKRDISDAINIFTLGNLGVLAFFDIEDIHFVYNAIIVDAITNAVNK